MTRTTDQLAAIEVKRQELLQTLWDQTHKAAEPPVKPRMGPYASAPVKKTQPAVVVSEESIKKQLFELNVQEGVLQNLLMHELDAKMLQLEGRINRLNERSSR